MGYYTKYKLEVIEGSKELIEEFRGVSECARFAIDGNGDSEESSKWYRRQDELKKFSLLYPDALFKLYGEGEGVGDIWYEYYKNGKMQLCKAQIVFAGFDVNLLK